MTKYQYRFMVYPLVLPDDWRTTSASPTLLAVWRLFVDMPRVEADMTEAEFAVFRSNLEVAGYRLQEIERVPLPLPRPESVE